MRLPLYKLLSYLGLIPFIVCAVGLFVFDAPADNPFFAIIQLLYSGLILSFLSGMIWSHALPLRRPLPTILSMVPSVASLFVLAAALISDTYDWALLFFCLGFIAMYVLDKMFIEDSWVPVDYLRLRLILTAIVSGSLFLSAAAFWV